MRNKSFKQILDQVLGGPVWRSVHNQKSCQYLMMKKTLFLDFDGVLHPTTPTPERPLFCRIGALEEVIADHGCAIVISSSWRHHYPDPEILAHFPPSLQCRINGSTGRPHIGKWPRYQEIRNYLDLHGHHDWRALDDSFMEFSPGCPELIKCDPNEGIGGMQLKQLQTWLFQSE